MSSSSVRTPDPTRPPRRKKNVSGTSVNHLQHSPSIANRAAQLGLSLSSPQTARSTTSPADRVVPPVQDPLSPTPDTLSPTAESKSPKRRTAPPPPPKPPKTNPTLESEPTSTTAPLKPEPKPRVPQTNAEVVITSPTATEKLSSPTALLPKKPKPKPRMDLVRSRLAEIKSNPQLLRNAFATLVDTTDSAQNKRGNPKQTGALNGLDPKVESAITTILSIDQASIDLHALDYTMPEDQDAILLKKLFIAARNEALSSLKTSRDLTLVCMRLHLFSTTTGTTRDNNKRDLINHFNALIECAVAAEKAAEQKATALLSPTHNPPTSLRHFAKSRPLSTPMPQRFSFGSTESLNTSPSPPSTPSPLSTSSASTSSSAAATFDDDVLTIIRNFNLQTEDPLSDATPLHKCIENVAKVRVAPSAFSDQFSKSLSELSEDQLILLLNQLDTYRTRQKIAQRSRAVNQITKAFASPAMSSRAGKIVNAYGSESSATPQTKKTLLETLINRHKTSPSVDGVSNLKLLISQLLLERLDVSSSPQTSPTGGLFRSRRKTISPLPAPMAPPADRTLNPDTMKKMHTLLDKMESHPHFAKEVGIFRVARSTKLAQQEANNPELIPTADDSFDIHRITDCLKFHTQSDGIFDKETIKALYQIPVDQLTAVTRTATKGQITEETDSDQIPPGLSTLKNILQKLSPKRKALLKHLVRLMKAVADNAEETRMPASNISKAAFALFFSKGHPEFLPTSQDTASKELLDHTTANNAVGEILINHLDFLLPD